MQKHAFLGGESNIHFKNIRQGALQSGCGMLLGDWDDARGLGLGITLSWGLVGV